MTAWRGIALVDPIMNVLPAFRVRSSVPAMRPLPFTIRFFTGQEYPPGRANHTTIYYMGYRFGQAWMVLDDWDAHLGKWQFNCGSFALHHEWTPMESWHDTLEDLVSHLEETFPGVMP